MGYHFMKVLLFIIGTLLALSFGKRLWKKEEVNLGYDFETDEDLNHSENNAVHIKLDNALHKHGKQSLNWRWSVNERLMFDLTPQYEKYSGNRKICGVHFWIHQKKPVNTRLLVTYHNKYGDKFSFRIRLNFRNWRAVARTFRVDRTKWLKDVQKIEFEVEQSHPHIQTGVLNLDLIRISKRCVGWAYDFINPPQVLLPKSELNEIDEKEDLTGYYGIGNFWQQMYRWRKVDLHNSKFIDAKTKLSVEENTLTKELIKIETRVDNWHFPNVFSHVTLDNLSKSKLNSLRYCDLYGMEPTSKDYKNWLRNFLHGNFPHKRKAAFASKDSKHAVCISSAYKKLFELPDLKSDQLPSLFASRDVFPNGHENVTGLKFNEVIHRILFPLSLEYFISKRKAQRKQALNSGSQSRDRMLDTLANELEFEPKLLKNINNQKNIYKTFKAIDNRRLKKFRLLFQYLASEGWDDGSSLGNTDHLLNLNAGFTHSLYLLRKDLKNYKIFKQLLNTARWYNEIGELHQKQFPHHGTTADKVKGSMLGRLFTILSSPIDTIKETRQKIIDAKNLKRWVENALEINEGYGGLIKPDFIGYHHKGPYISAYVPFALQSLSLVAYFLHGTSFAISTTHLLNLQNALKTMYIMSNDHAIPLGVSGAKVSNANTNINEILPAFAYLSLALGGNQAIVDPDMASIFLRLYKKNDPFIKKDLVEGKPYLTSHYLNPIGSIRIFEKVYKLAKTGGIKPAQSPSGNWAKNYAALSIHRRHDWTVSVKGFSKYLWDYESTVDQNIYGRYFSHGNMQISNGRSSFEAHDIFSGWDWNKIPGTTTVQLKLPELRSQEKCRYFSNKTTVGGLSFDRKKSRNGIFVMDFKQPLYLDSFFQLNRYSFDFKKSYLFYESMIICLGSNINKSGLKNRKVSTTLFQNKLKGQTQVRVNGDKFSRRNRVDMNYNNNEPMTFLDANNNGYFIPAKKENNINFKIAKNLDSEMPNGVKVDVPKVYASATFDHGSNPKDSKYEYAVLIDSGMDKLNSFTAEMSPVSTVHPPPYNVLRQDDIAHIVKIQRKTTIVTGYTIFDSDKFLGETDQHFIRKLNRPCVVMVKETEQFLTVGVMDPDLRMFETYIPSSKAMKEGHLYDAKSKESWLFLTFNQNVKLLSKRNRYPNLKKSISDIFYEKTEFGDVRPRIKMLLSHGLTTEIKLQKIY